jgi:7,8-dihydropterin-6-yl-methyl-4-(beta-D-ribofuranosyl)aminobenzene 5'-phosphate synthase
VNESERFDQARNVAITILVENRADLIVKSSDAVTRFTDQPLLAEHGFAALVDLRDAGLKILWDAGITSHTLLENMRRMELDPAAIAMIALSHGHGDHTAAMTQVIKAIAAPPVPRKWGKDVPMADILRWVEPRRVPLVAHPAAFRERWSVRQDGTRHGPGLPPPRAEWEAVGADVVLSDGPHELGPGCWTTGTVPRRSFEGTGTSSTRAYRVGDQFLPDGLEDDQAIVLNVAGKGLVVLAGCAHAGIVNTVRHAQQISGVDRVWGILGGFHLAPANEEEIARTVDEIAALDPQMVSPMHCTGLKAISQFAHRMPEAFVLGVVGTTYLF